MQGLRCEIWLIVNNTSGKKYESRSIFKITKCFKNNFTYGLVHNQIYNVFCGFGLANSFLLINPVIGIQFCFLRIVVKQNLINTQVHSKRRLVTCDQVGGNRIMLCEHYKNVLCCMQDKTSPIKVNGRQQKILTFLT